MRLFTVRVRNQGTVGRRGARNIQCMAEIKHGGLRGRGHDMMFVRGGRLQSDAFAQHLFVARPSRRLTRASEICF